MRKGIHRNILGFMLIDAPHSALNNAGSDASERTDNIVRVKKIRKGRDIYPYVSGQALRYWWRTSLENIKKWNTSPVTKTDSNVAYTEANPFIYDDDDIFGYMRAQKIEVELKGKKKKKDITITRLSPLKCSPLISVIKHTPVEDFSSMTRHEGDPVIYQHEFYSTVLKGIFSLDIDSVGIFTSIFKTGYLNVRDVSNETLIESGATKIDDEYMLPKDVRVKRIRDTISVLPYLSGGAKQTSHHTDVTPSFIILTLIEGGNHVFMNLADEDRGEVKINLDAIREIIKDYGDIIRTDIFIGKRKGFMDNLEPELSSLSNEYDSKDIKIHTGSVIDAVKGFLKQFEEIKL